MRNSKVIIFIILGLFITGLVSNLLSIFVSKELFGSVTDFLLSLSKLTALFLMIRTGTTYKTTYFQILVPLHFILVIGAIFKIMHWPGAGLMLTISLSLIPIVYAIRFIKKESKRIVDILKLIWVILAYLIGCAIIQHWIDGYYFKHIPNVAFWTMVLVYSIFELKSKNTSANTSYTS